MNKKAKISLIVTASVLGAIPVAVIVLCRVTVKPLKDFMDYDTVNVTPYESSALPGGTVKDKHKAELDKALESTSFSIMHATLEFVGSYGPEFVMTEDKDGNEQKQALTIADARSACAATENSYMLELGFDKVREYEVDGEKIKYDRMIMNVTTTNGEVKWVRIYLFEYAYEISTAPENADYRVNPVRVRMDTSDLYIALGNIAKKITEK